MTMTSHESPAPAYRLWDGIHPNAAGRCLIRTEWRTHVRGEAP